MEIVKKINNTLQQDKRKNLIIYFEANGSFQDELQEIEALAKNFNANTWTKENKARKYNNVYKT